MKKYFLKGQGDLNRKLIDVGIGSGYVSIEMAKLGLEVYAQDISKSVITNIARFNKELGLKNIHPVLSSAEKIPLKNSTVDYLVANALLEHCQNEKEVIDEWLRVLRPGGRISITVPHKYRYIWPFFWPIDYLHDKNIGHLRRYDLKDLKKKFSLKVVKVLYSGHILKMIWFFLSIFVQNKTVDDLVEKHDSCFESKVYGAENITVIFEKP